MNLLQPSKILIVDDVELNAKLLKAILDSAGFSISTCSSERETLAILEHEKPDLIFMDIHLGNAPSFSLPKIIHDMIGNVPIIAHTADATLSSSRCRGYGFEGLLPKPFEAAALRAIVLASLGVDIDDVAREESDDIEIDVLKNEFLAGVSCRCTRIREAYDAGDIATLIRESHQLCGAAAVFAYHDLADIAAAIEESAGYSCVQTLREQIAKLVSWTETSADLSSRAE